MPLSLKEVSEKIGIDIEKLEKIEDFNTEYDKKFIARDLIASDADLMKKLTGKRYGELETLVLQQFELKKEDAKEKKLEEVLALGVEKLKSAKTALETKVSELEILATKDIDEKTSAIKKQLEEAHKEAEALKKRESELLGFNTNLKTELEQKEKNFTSEIKTYKINDQLEKVKSSIPFKKGMTEVEKNGLETILNAKYKFDLNDENKLVVMTMDGGVVANEKGNAAMTPEDVIKVTAKANNLLEVNNAGNGQPQPKKPEPKKTDDGENHVPVRKIHPNAVKHAAMLNELSQ